MITQDTNKKKLKKEKKKEIVRIKLINIQGLSKANLVEVEKLRE